jgi:WD40 repeat protein/serine/threonine protein kinase
MQRLQAMFVRSVDFVGWANNPADAATCGTWMTSRRLLSVYALLVAERDLSGRTFGKYRLIRRIGKGGQGDVYRAEQLPLRPCVVKVLRDERLNRSNNARQRFRREAELASRLDHPYAAHIYDFGTEGDIESDDVILWIAMELVEGVPLDEWMKTNGPISLEQFVPFFECLAEVLQTAHDLGIVHRDVKPANVMVIVRAGRIFPKLLDLGIAKLVDRQAGHVAEGALAENASTNIDHAWTPRTVSIRPALGPRTDAITGPLSRGQCRLTTAGTRMGSLECMSPEQWADSPDVGPAADLYALGVLAYEMLTGHLPFQAETAEEYSLLHRHRQVPPLGSPELDRVFGPALAKNPQDRQRDVMALAAAFRAAQRAIKSEHIRSSAQTWVDRGRPSRLLWSASMLAEFERTRTLNTRMLTELECEFIERSQRRARRATWLRRAGVALAFMGLVAAFQYRSAKNKQVAEAARVQAELEQGRAAGLHGEPDAVAHLTAAYESEPSPSTAFMLARALQPRLAEQARLSAIKGRMWSAAFSPDGKQIVATDDSAAQVWDAATNLRRFVLPHEDIVYHAIYSADGKQIVTACGDGAVRIWDAASGRLLHQLHRDGAKLRYYLVAMSADGKLVAAIDVKGELAEVWDASTGISLAELRNDASWFPSIEFSSNGLLATSGGNDVRVFDVRTWAQAVAISGPHIHGLSWDPSGQQLLTGSADGDVSLWRIPSGERVHHLREVGEPVDAVAFAPDGRLVVAAGRDGAEQVWDAIAGKLQSQGNYLHGKILSVEFDPTSTLVVAAGTSGSVAVADTALGMPVTVVGGPRNVVQVAHFDPSSQHVLGASWDGTVRMWDATPLYRRWGSLPIADDCGLTTSLEPDGRFVAVRCGDQNTRVWDTAHDRLLAELPSVTQVSGDFTSAYPAVSASGDRAAIARGNAVEVYELPSRHLLRTVAHGAAVDTVAFASTGHDLVSGAIDGSVLVTRDSGAQILLPPSSAGIDAAGFLPDGRIVAADANRQLRIYERGGELLATLVTPARVRMLRASPDSRRLITVPSYLREAAQPVLWDLEHYRIIATLEGAVVYSARWVAGDQVVTACDDGTARLWDGATGRLRQTFSGGSRFLADVTLSPDGSMIVGGGGDGLLRFWDASTGRQMWTMPAHKSPLIGVHFQGDDIVTRGFSGEMLRWTLPRPQQVIESCRRHDRCAIVRP